jgi:cytochrome c oxidase subunit 2
MSVAWKQFAKFLIITLLLLPCSAFAAYTLNMGEGVTPLSRDVYHLHMTIFWICCAIGAVVFGVMFYAVFKHRKAAGHKASTFHESITIEIIWTIIPFIILIAMAVPATKVLIRMADTRDSDLTIKVTGYQWKWEYNYLNHNVHFFSNLSSSQDAINNREPKGEHYLLEVDNPVVVPINKKIRFLTTANDVIHSWWVPALGMKKDAIPGFINEMWAIIERPGIYRGQCAELCGVLHAYMPIVIEAKTQEDFDAWLLSQKSKTS